MSDLAIVDAPEPFVSTPTDDQTVDPRVKSMIDELLAFKKEEEEEEERERLMEEEKEEGKERLEEIKGRLEDAREDARENAKERLELEEEDADEETKETLRLEEEEEAREIAKLEELFKEEKEKWEEKWGEKWVEEEEEEGRSFTRSATTPMHNKLAKLFSFSCSKIRFINESNTPVIIMYTHDLVSVMMKSCGIETNVGAGGVGVKLDVVREKESEKEVKAVLTLPPGKKQDVLYAPKRILLSVCTLREGALNLLYSNLKLQNGSAHTIEQSDVDNVLAEEDIERLKMLAL
ncbi:hypothetical protein EC991_005819 [Linnemannia zychae]|nr:hypothetical protein EC991_005819 [Linnemannia zychae]